MKKLLLFAVTIVPALCHAQSDRQLSVETFISQVQSSNPNLESATLLEESSNELQNEGNHFYVPAFFTEFAHTYDKRQTLVPTFQGTKTVTDSTSLGISQDTNFGLNASLYYSMVSSEVTGVDPAFYPNPNLNVNSLNLQFTQPLLRGGFGRSVRATVASKNALNNANLYQNKFSRKMILADAASKYWQLSIGRTLIGVQQHSLERTKTFHEINTRRAKYNLVDSADVVASQAAIKQRELELQNAIDQEKIYARSFNLVRGKNSAVVPEELIIPTPEMIQSLPALEKKNQREDVLASQASVDVTRENAIYASDQRLPQLDAFGTFSTNGLNPSFWDATSDTFDTDHPSFTIGARLNVPLDFKKNIKIRRAYQKQILGAEKSFEQAKLDDEANWNSLSDQWNNARSRLKMALDLKKVQTTKLEKEKERQKQGRSTTYQVFLFEQDLLNSEIIILQTELLAMNAYTQMKTYLD